MINENFVAPMKLILYFFIISPPMKIPRPTGGKLVTPERDYRGQMLELKNHYNLKSQSLSLVFCSWQLYGLLEDLCSVQPLGYTCCL